MRDVAPSRAVIVCRWIRGAMNGASLFRNPAMYFTQCSLPAHLYFRSYRRKKNQPTQTHILTLAHNDGRKLMSNFPIWTDELCMHKLCVGVCVSVKVDGLIYFAFRIDIFKGD